MDNNSSFTNVIIVIILVLLVGFGVWYFTMRSGQPAPAPTGSTGGVQIDVGGQTPPPSTTGGTPTPAPGY